MMMGPRRVAPWIQNPNRGHKGTYHSAEWDNDREVNERCPDCKGVLTKKAAYFDIDTGKWTRFRTCLMCGHRVWEQEKKTRLLV